MPDEIQGQLSGASDVSRTSAHEANIELEATPKRLEAAFAIDSIIVFCEIPWMVRSHPNRGSDLLRHGRKARKGKEIVWMSEEQQNDLREIMKNWSMEEVKDLEERLKQRQSWAGSASRCLPYDEQRLLNSGLPQTAHLFERCLHIVEEEIGKRENGKRDNEGREDGKMDDRKRECYKREMEKGPERELEGMKLAIEKLIRRAL